MNKRNSLLTVLCLLLTAVLLFNFSGCGTAVKAADLMDGISANTVQETDVDDIFLDNQMALYLKLFKSSALTTKDKNTLVSPLSIQLALAMTANGANGTTKAEMENLLGGDLTLEQLNQCLYSYVNSLPSGDRSKLEIANSIWFRDNEDRLTVKKEFLQTNADYYGADAYKAPFDDTTLADINGWVDEHTDGMIDKVLEEIDPAAIMYLLNAIVFDAEWIDPYVKSSVFNGKFNSISGEAQTVEMMRSEEHNYLDDGKATGFIKHYQGGYSFAALLPDSDVDLYDYISQLDAATLRSTLKNPEGACVFATMPKFSYEYELKMNDALATHGMVEAFDASKADFSRLGSSPVGNIYVHDVIHKTFISVNEKGTKAGAVTKVEVRLESAYEPTRTVTLDRPFVYMIVDNATSLPVFMGVVTEIQQ